MRPISHKMLNVHETAQWIHRQKMIGKSVVLTNGCFDILHRGHLEYLSTARSLGDVLVIVVNGDNGVKELKGPSRPIFKAEDRAFMLASLECVDMVTVVDKARLDKEFGFLKPSIYVKGSDYSEDTLHKGEYSALKQNGCQFRFVKLTSGYSSTSILERLKSTW